MATRLNYDAQGFIVGLGRVESNTKCIHDDTQEIIRILLSQRQVGDTRLQDMNKTLRDIHTSLNRLPANINSGKTKDYAPKSRANSKNKSVPLSRTTRDYGSNGSGNSTRNNPNSRTIRARADRTAQSSQALDRKRDGKGRFTAQAEDAKFIDKLSGKLGDSLSKNLNIDDKNLDPLIDSFHEVKDALSPISGVLGFIRDKAEQRRERKHDKAVEDNLEAIAENTGGGGNGRGGRGGGFLGSMAGRIMGGIAGSALGGIGGMAVGALGGVGKMATKLGGKKLGLLGTALGAGSLAMNWGNLDHEGKSAGVGGLVGGAGGAMAGATAGAMIGSVVPVIGTAIGGVAGGLIGGWLGDKGGEALGKTASPYIQSWTNSLERYHLGAKLKTAFDFGMNPFFTGITALLPSLNDWVAKTTGVDIAKGFSDLWAELKAKLGFGSPTNPNAPINVDMTGATNGADIGGDSGRVGGGVAPSWFGTNVDEQRKKVRNSGILGGKDPDHTKSHVGVYNGILMAKDLLGSAYDHSSALSDKYHVSHNPRSQHNHQLAWDMTINRKKKSIQQAQAELKNKYEQMGVSVVTEDEIRASKGKLNQHSRDVYLRDEEKYPTPGTTGPHLHANYSSRAAADKAQLAMGGGGVLKSGAGGGRGGALKRGVGNTKYDSLILASAARNGVDPAFMKAMMDVESDFNPNARSDKNAQGLIQMLPATFRQYAKGENRNAFNPADNIEVAARFTKHLQDKFHGNKALMAAAYNAGEYRDSLRAGRIPNIPETQKHVKKVMAKYEVYKGSDEQAIPPSTKLQATATSKKGMTPPNVPASKKEKPAKPPVVQQKVSSDDDDDTLEKKGVLGALGLGGLVAQNVSDRGIAHGVTGGLGDDRWLG